MSRELVYSDLKPVRATQKSVVEVVVSVVLGTDARKEPKVV